MRRVCCRPGCAEPAVASYTFDPRQQAVWLGDLDGGSASDLCEAHADRLSPPRGWSMLDMRSRGARELVSFDAASPMLARAFRAARAS